MNTRTRHIGTLFPPEIGNAKQQKLGLPGEIPAGVQPLLTTPMPELLSRGALNENPAPDQPLRSTNSESLNLVSEDDIANFWTIMGQIFGQGWGWDYGLAGGPTSRFWLKQMQTQGVTPEGLKSAVHKIIAAAAAPGASPSTRRRSPSLGEVIAYTRPTPEELGLPPLHKAIQEAVRAANNWGTHQWSHPAVYLATMDVGPDRLRFMNTKESENEFGKAYQKYVEQTLKGELPPQVIQRIEPRGKQSHRVKLSAEAYAARMAAVRASLRGAGTKPSDTISSTGASEDSEPEPVSGLGTTGADVNF